VANYRSSLCPIVSLSSLPGTLASYCVARPASLYRNNAAEQARRKNKSKQNGKKKALHERRIVSRLSKPKIAEHSTWARIYGLGGIESAVATPNSLHWLVIAGFSLAALQCHRRIRRRTENAGPSLVPCAENAKQLSAQSHQTRRWR